MFLKQHLVTLVLCMFIRKGPSKFRHYIIYVIVLSYHFQLQQKSSELISAG